MHPALTVWFRLQELPKQFPGLTYGIAGITVTTAIIVLARLSRRPNLDRFPTVGSDGLLGSWRAGFKFLKNGIDVIQEGYEKHQSAPFKIADPYGWIVVLSDREHLEELRRTPLDELSLVEATSDRLGTRYTLGDEIHDTQYHVAVVRSQLTRSTGKMYLEIKDEIVTAFEEIFDIGGEEWESVSVLGGIQKVVCRSTSRLFVGLPLCRDPDWIDLNIRHAVDSIKIGLKIVLLPRFIRPLAARFFTTIARDVVRGEKHLGPIIEERLKHLNECGDKWAEWAEKPEDLVSWLIEEIESPQLTVRSLTIRVLAVNFAAIHTTPRSFTYALFYLAANPKYIQPLREEVEAIIEREGWSKTALSEMRKIDSFLRECQRLGVGNSLSVMRKAMKDFTFLDGTFIPKGTTIGVPTRCLHLDEKFYKNAHVFDPFRFSEIQEEDGESVDGHQFVSTSVEYQPFGHGQHACPGRFLAASIMKTMLAYIVTTYDVKLEDGVTHPQSVRYGSSILPSPSAKVLFRRRAD